MATTKRVLTKTTVNLIARAVADLEELGKMTDLTHTDNINRAIQVYAELMRAKEAGKRIAYIRPDNKLELLILT